MKVTHSDLKLAKDKVRPTVAVVVCDSCFVSRSCTRRKKASPRVFTSDLVKCMAAVAFCLLLMVTICNLLDYRVGNTTQSTRAVVAYAVIRRIQ
jgi:hypothetical protein